MTEQASTQTDKSIKQNAIVTFGIRLLGAGLLYLVQIALARLLGESDYGLYALIWVWVVVLSQISCLGFNTAILRFFPRYILHSKPHNARAFLAQATSTALGFAALFALIGLVGTFTFSDWIEQSYIWPIYLAMACLPLFALGEIYEGAALSRSHIVAALVPSFILRPLILLISMLLAIFAGLPANATTAMQAALFATALATGIQVLTAKRKLHRELTLPAAPPHKGSQKQKQSQKQNLRWIEASAPLFLLDGFYLITLNADIILLGLFLGPDKIGIYYAAIKTLAMVSYIHFATSLVAARPFADLFALHAPHEEVNRLYRKMTHWTLWPSCLAALFIILASPYILSLFGPNFQQGQDIILILAIGLVIQGAAGPVQNLLNMAGLQKTSASSAFWAMAINISLNLALIPLLGLKGAAIATTISTAFQAGLMLYKAHKKLGLRPVFLPSTKKRSPELAAKTL
ncbi:MAG: oligosaccharide flippase family protein [Cohaesibacter sp.]|jgi:O-antigen/teichoic acid export membrane protein|nr:oligosaccharide flippase family protein [Cohaesibacter sp.]